MTEFSTVSIIIPCFNQARYLDQSIQSALNQSWPSVEIIVVNDGSTEDIKGITDRYPEVIYIFQKNQGVSSARNRGVLESSGQYLVFLDADDWLYPDAIEKNLVVMRKNPDTALVFGIYDVFYEESNNIYEISRKLESNLYKQFLKTCVIGMPGIAMYQKWVFDLFQFDECLQFYVEDYDLYLKIVRSHKILGHNEKIAVYRKHSTNVSGNSFNMLQGVLMILEKNRNNLKSFDEIVSFWMGKYLWKKYYGTQILKRARLNPFYIKQGTTTEFAKLFPGTLLMLLPFQILNRLYKKMIYLAKEYAPDIVLENLYKAGFYRSYITNSDSAKDR